MVFSPEISAVLLAFGDAMTIVGAVAGVIFAGVWRSMSKGRLRRSPAGRAVFNLVVLIVLLLALNGFTLYFGVGYPGREVIRLAVYAGPPIAFVYLTWLVVKLIRAGDITPEMTDKERAAHELRARDFAQD